MVTSGQGCEDTCVCQHSHPPPHSPRSHRMRLPCQAACCTPSGCSASCAAPAALLPPSKTWGRGTRPSCAHPSSSLLAAEQQSKPSPHLGLGVGCWCGVGDCHPWQHPPAGAARQWTRWLLSLCCKVSKEAHRAEGHDIWQREAALLLCGLFSGCLVPPDAGTLRVAWLRLPRGSRGGSLAPVSPPWHCH